MLHFNTPFTDYILPADCSMIQRAPANSICLQVQNAKEHDAKKHNYAHCDSAVRVELELLALFANHSFRYIQSELALPHCCRVLQAGLPSK